MSMSMSMTDSTTCKYEYYTLLLNCACEIWLIRNHSANFTCCRLFLVWEREGGSLVFISPIDKLTRISGMLKSQQKGSKSDHRRLETKKLIRLIINFNNKLTHTNNRSCRTANLAPHWLWSCCSYRVEMCTVIKSRRNKLVISHKFPSCLT